MKANTWANKPLRYYSRKRSLSSPAASRPQFGTKGHMANHNKWDYYSGPELYQEWEKLRDKLADAISMGEHKRITYELERLQASKNWIK